MVVRGHTPSPSFFLFLFSATALFDAVSTFYLVSLHGLGAELNPVWSLLFSHVGVSSGVIVGLFIEALYLSGITLLLGKVTNRIHASYSSHAIHSRLDRYSLRVMLKVKWVPFLFALLMVANNLYGIIIYG